MKLAVTCLTIALLVFALPSAIIADQDSAQTEDSESIVDKIIDAVADLLGLDDGGSDEPLENVHPPDYNPPTDGIDGDDHGWEDNKK